MTAIYSIPNTISNQYRFRSKPVNARIIKAIVPTYEEPADKLLERIRVIPAVQKGRPK
ncbi:MAG: hypothetical protein ABSF10_10530 [Verrucomicrobiota bacterium]|jgi:hypothetical protein